jgi:Na+/melibiose symporter-like transporter
MATLGLIGVVFGLIEGQRFNWGTVWSWITIPEIIGAGLLVLVLFLVTQWVRQDREPLLPFAVFKDRNYTLMTLVLMAMGFAIVGVFLPLTIYFQSVLGLSAFDAGLATAPQPVAMVLVSGPVAALAVRFGGKYILMVGLILFALGMAYVAWTAQVSSNRWSFLPGLIVAGVGMGCVWTPVFSLATRDLKPQLAGVASGVINTIQELGAVIASAAIGAILQNRLAVGLHDQAVSRAGQLPQQVRGPFIDGFSHAASSGLEIGRGQTGGSLQLPAGVPAQVAHQIEQVAQAVFGNAFVSAMRPAMALPIAIILVAAVGCLAVRGRGAAAPARTALETSEQPASVA